MYHKSNPSYLRHGPLPHFMLGVVSKVSLDTGNRGQYWSALQLISHATHTHTHTHTHVGFCGLRGLSIGVMVFILYNLYVLLPYTYPTPKLSPHRRLCASLDFQKNTI